MRIKKVGRSEGGVEDSVAETKEVPCGRRRENIPECKNPAAETTQPSISSQE